MQVEVSRSPFGVTIRRGGRRLLGPIGVAVWDGAVQDHFVQLTEGVLAHEELGDPVRAVTAEPDEGVRPLESGRLKGSDPSGVWRLALDDGSRARLRVDVAAPDRVRLELVPERPALRLAFTAPGHPEQQFTGLGARHGLHVDQAGRELQLGADRRYTGPDCPPDMLEIGGIPQGDYAPVPWVLASRGWAAWLQTDGHGARFALGDELAISARAAAGSLVLHVFSAPTPAARLRAFLRLTGMPALLPEWAYGHWKSRDVYEHQRDVEADFRGYRRNDLPLDAIVIDSPWETQYNTWRFNPNQFPDPEGLVRGMREDGVRTVVW